MFYVNNEFKFFSCLGALMKNDKPVVFLASQINTYFIG